MKKDPYKTLSRYYDSFVEPSNKVLRKILYRLYPPEQGMHVLEVGCGTGTNLQIYHNAGCEIFGIDLSPSMLAQARDKLPGNSNLSVGDASNMHYESDQFDIVIGMLTLHEMAGKIRTPVFAEMKRVVKSNGRILLVDFHPGPIEFPKGWISKFVISFFELTAGFTHFINYRSFLKAEGLQTLIRSQNLIIEKEKIVSGGNIALYVTKLPEYDIQLSSKNSDRIVTAHEMRNTP